MNPARIVAFGEVLWDILPEGDFPGGAPANFAIHCAALGADATLISRVGEDELGRRMTAFLESRGVDCSGLDVDADHPTGTVDVRFVDGEPHYTIHEDVSWDFLAPSPVMLGKAESADAFYFGTLSQRNPRSRAALRQLLSVCPEKTLRFLDVNIRPPHFSRSILVESLELANAIKLNEHELAQIGEMLGLPSEQDAALRLLAENHQLRLVALTMGACGSSLWTEGRIFRHRGFPVSSVHPVGAGDSFAAALLTGLLGGMSVDQANAFANEIAAFVASQPAATPTLPAHLLPRAPSIMPVSSPAA